MKKYYCKKCGLKRFENGEEGEAITVSLNQEYSCSDCNIKFKYKYED